MTADASAQKRSFAAAGVLAAALTVFVLQALLLAHSHLLLGDFRAFYCGGSAALHGANPYSARTISACERLPEAFGLYGTPRGLAEPVPFPGYCFVLFAPFALLPYVPAAVLWVLTGFACLAGAARALARLCGRGVGETLTVFAVAYPIAVLALGEVAAVVLFALCACALALREERDAAAVAWLCVAALLPHVAAPAFAALLIFKPGARRYVAAAAAILLALDFAIGGPRVALEYVLRVLPAHAHSEIGYVAQYGLSWMLHAAGATDAIALRAGTVSYALMCAAGIWCAASIAGKARNASFLALVPPAFAVTGGPFIHYSEITLALPAFLLMFTQFTQPVRTAAAAATLAVAFPWQWSISGAWLLLPATAIGAFGISVGVLRLEARYGLRIALAALLYCALILIAALQYGPQLQSWSAPHLDGGLAQASWTTYVRGHHMSAGIVWWLAKLPTWIGLALGVAGSLLAAAQKDLEVRVAVEPAPLRL
jgi:hypothetical protein